MTKIVNITTMSPSEAEIEKWFDAEDEVSEQATPPISLESKYTESQLRIVRTAMDFSLHMLKSSLADSSYINLAPQYQRRNRWDLIKRSRLIESFLMNIPVPPIFLYENKYNQYEVMDGRQRLETISEFFSNRFALKGMEFWRELDGQRFSELPSIIQRGLLRRTVSAVVLLAETNQLGTVDDDVRMILFRRLNTGGIKLNPQELRNALYPGPFNQLIRRLARDDGFTRLWNIPARTPNEDEDPSAALANNTLYKTMADCEIVLRFFAIHDIVSADKRGSLRRILDAFMQDHANSTQEELDHYELLFRSSLSKLISAFPDNPLILPTTGRLSRSLYEALMVAVSLNTGSPDGSPEELRSRLNAALSDPDKYDILIGRGNTIDMIKDRVKLGTKLLFGEV